jgi:photosystem II stability/assembly factor-like uncharacterized protein
MASSPLQQVHRSLPILLTISLLLASAAGVLTPSRAAAAYGWQQVYAGSNELHGVFALNASNAWVAGANGTILHWDGAAWNSQPSATYSHLWSVYALDTQHIWAVGDSGVILFSNNNGSTWAQQGTGLTNNNLWGIFATDASNAWALGGIDGSPSYGVILHWDGQSWSKSWSKQSTTAAVGMNWAWGPDANHIWAVGNNGQILFWDGSAKTWSPQNSGTTVELSVISALDSSHMWVCGRNGTMLYGNGSTWSRQTTGTTNYITSVSAIDQSHVWAGIQYTGAAKLSSAILFSNGSNWAPQDGISPSLSIHGVYALDAAHVWAAGMDGNVYFYAGPEPSSLTLTAPNGGQTLNAGSAYRIAWSAPSVMTWFKVKWSWDDGATWQLIPDAGRVTRNYLDWTAGAPPTGNSDSVKIKVTGFTSSGANSGYDVSDQPFSIVVLKVGSPNGGTTIKSNTTTQIKWTTYSTVAPISRVKLQYSKDGGATWIPIRTFSGSNPGTYNWVVQPVANTKSQCLVRVVLKDAGSNTVGTDTSDNFFAIAP